MTRPFILASASESRRRMLTEAGLAFTVAVPPINEEAAKQALLAREASATEIASALAELKAVTVSKQKPEALVLGADQLLVCDGVLYAKAKDVKEAKNILRALAGRKHELITAAVLAKNGASLWRHVETATLWMRDLPEADLEAYAAAAGNALLTCVGGYRIEEEGARLFTRMDGDRFTIQGLPLGPALSALRAHGIVPQ